MEEGSRQPKASPKVLKDCIHVVKFYLLDGLPEPPCEVLYGLFFVFQNSSQGTNIPFLRIEHRCCKMNVPQSS